MRAVVYDKYGSPEVLRLEEVDRPVPKDDEVLVRIRATTVNRSDCGWRSAKPFISRYFTGIRRPKRRILGSELAGEVEAVGAAVSQFKVGDHVFGVNYFGAHAEFVCVREDRPLAHKPAGMTFEEAAAASDGAILALTALRKGDLRKGQKILIYGASGSIGTAAVQLAKHFEADVTAVCNTKNVELVRSLGADEVVDYLQEDFTKNGKTYDAVFDAVGKHSFRRCRRSVKPDIHPDYHKVLFVDSATGQEWLSRSTITSAEKRSIDGEEVPVVKLEISSASHPLWTGQSRELDTEGRVERFRKRYGTKAGCAIHRFSADELEAAVRTRCLTSTPPSTT